MRITNEKRATVAALVEKYGTTTLTRKQIVAFSKERGEVLPRWLLNSKQFRIGRAGYDLNLVLNQAAAAPAETAPVATAADTTATK